MGKKMKLEIKSLDGEPLGEIEFEGPEDFMVTVSMKVERSPLHPEALNIDDLQVGMNIKRYNVRHGSCLREVVLVNGKPFRRGTKYNEKSDTLRDSWMVPVVTTNYAGKLVQEDWYLADMGVVPYEQANGSCSWNDQNYTLAI